MTKEEIIQKLTENHRVFVAFIASLTDQDFLMAPEGKWNAAQQLDHLVRAVSPLVLGLRLPNFALRLLFGRANRPSRSYDDLVKKYLSKLEAGGKASGRFIPSRIAVDASREACNKLSKKIKQLVRIINKYSEIQLDTFILPHPLLGKVTLREMMYFTIYHAEHHLKQARRNIGK